MPDVANRRGCYDTVNASGLLQIMSGYWLRAHQAACCTGADGGIHPEHVVVHVAGCDVHQVIVVQAFQPAVRVLIIPARFLVAALVQDLQHADTQVDRLCPARPKKILKLEGTKCASLRSRRSSVRIKRPCVQCASLS